MSGHNIVCFSTADWDTLLPTNKHQLMRRLARHNRVLYIETLGTRAPRAASGADLARIGRRLKRGFEGARKRERNLWSLSPVVRPKWDTPLARELNRQAFRIQAGGVLVQFPKPIVWVYSPFAAYLLDDLEPSLVVYHQVDDLAAVPGADAAAIREAEARMLARAECVFCTERSLFDRARRINPAARWMPNVADYRHFSRPREVQDERLEALRALPAPRMVFSGHIAPHKVDLRLLHTLARARPRWSFALIGPEWEGGRPSLALERLRGLPNVRFFGHVPYEDLPAYLHAASVLLIPYVRNDATRAVFPLKFFEYLATGRPVVASPLPSLLPYSGAVPLAESPGEWLEACEAALADENGLADQRRALARRNTWDVRLREMEGVILEKLAARE
ncbi:glycosyltransferase [Candidatus Poribacteria bacterium]|nr:glycosyltransferase [Candidatus Poribacteria bacterium]